MNIKDRFLVFSLGERRFAINLTGVDRVVRAVEVTPVPNAPEKIMGVINVQGWVTPVFDTRKMFCLPEKELELRDHFIISHTSKRRVALVVDSTKDVIECSERDLVRTEKFIDGVEYIKAVVKLPDGMVFILDLDNLLSHEEETMLDEVEARVVFE